MTSLNVSERDRLRLEFWTIAANNIDEISITTDAGIEILDGPTLIRGPFENATSYWYEFIIEAETAGTWAVNAVHSWQEAVNGQETAVCPGYHLYQVSEERAT